MCGRRFVAHGPPAREDTGTSPFEWGGRVREKLENCHRLVHSTGQMSDAATVSSN